MPQVRNLSVPGEASQDEVAEAQNPIVDADGLVVGQVDPGLMEPPSAGKVATMPLAGTEAQQIAALQAQLSDALRVANEQGKLLRALVPQKSAAAVAALPTVEEVQASKPTAPTQTREGWFVPRVTPSNPERVLSA